MPVYRATKFPIRRIAALLAVLGSVFTILSFFRPPPMPSAGPTLAVSGGGNIAVQGDGNHIQVAPSESRPDARFPGVWHIRYAYANAGGGILQFDGITEYFNNGGYNLSGKVQISGGDAGKAIEVIYAIRAAGDWQFINDRFLFRQHDLKSTPQTLSINEQPMSIAQLEKFTGRPFPNFAEEFAGGMSGEYQAVAIHENRMTFTATAPNGEPFQIDLLRRR